MVEIYSLKLKCWGLVNSFNILMFYSFKNFSKFLCSSENLYSALCRMETLKSMIKTYLGKQIKMAKKWGNLQSENVIFFVYWQQTLPLIYAVAQLSIMVYNLYIWKYRMHFCFNFFHGLCVQFHARRLKQQSWKPDKNKKANTLSCVTIPAYLLIPCKLIDIIKFTV